MVLWDMKTLLMLIVCWEWGLILVITRGRNMILAARLLCNMIRILMVRRTTWWVARIWRITELLVVGTMVSKSVLPDITGVVSLPNVAISPYIEIVTINNH